MPPAVNIDSYSAAAVRLTMLRGDLELAIGSGFLWLSDQTTCLVTAWHCLTGTHPTTRQPLSPVTAARPNRIKITFPARNTAHNYDLYQDLYTTEEDRPGWLRHRLGSEEVDVAVLPLAASLPSALLSLPVNSLTQTSDLAIQVGGDLFILGYPRNLSRFNLPIWKRASLAIDPGAVTDTTGNRHLLVDTASREGLSGGLAIARSTGSYQRVGGGSAMGAGTYTKVLGIYSGRIGTTDEFAAQIGIVWPIRYVEEIVSAGVQDDFT